MGVIHKTVGGGTVVQMVSTQTGAVATGVTAFGALDDNVPQNTGGDEYMTLAVTPTSATNKLKIEVNIGLLTHSESNQFYVVALFQDSTADALASIVTFPDGASPTSGNDLTLVHTMTAGTTSETTFKVRAGSTTTAATMTFNGTAGARKLGGSLASSITITEYTP